MSSMSAAKVYSEFSLILFIIDLQKLNFLSRGNVCVRAQLLSHMQLFAISWTWATRLFRPWNFPGKNTGMGCHFLLQEILPTQGSNPRLLCLLHCRWILYPLSHLYSSIYVNPKLLIYPPPTLTISFLCLWIYICFEYKLFFSM